MVSFLVIWYCEWCLLLTFGLLIIILSQQTWKVQSLYDWYYLSSTDYSWYWLMIIMEGEPPQDGSSFCPASVFGLACWLLNEASGWSFLHHRARQVFHNLFDFSRCLSLAMLSPKARGHHETSDLSVYRFDTWKCCSSSAPSTGKHYHVLE